jgi:hypothetical protein
MRSNQIFPGVASITLTTHGNGPSIDLRISKTGTPVQLVPEGTPGSTVVAVKRDEISWQKRLVSVVPRRQLSFDFLN